MKNSDLIAFLRPIHSQFTPPGTVELVDMSGRVSGIEASGYRLTIRLHVPAGLYSGHIETERGAFDVSTAMIDMVRVPDGKRVPVGPWDLDHIHNVMAMPMARTRVNGKLKGGLWFSMPGPAQIAEGRLSADFGFEAQEGDNEVVLELVERDRERMHWARLRSLELRKDDRRAVPLLPAAPGNRIFFRQNELPQIRNRWKNTPGFVRLCDSLRSEDLVMLRDNSQGTLELASLVYALTDDAVIGARAKARIMELAHAATWSGRPDPLLMGGDNDRAVSLRLYHLALGRNFLQPLFDEVEREVIRTKAEEYIGKVYDFTLLQRGYMGCPAIDPHSLGAWTGVAIACMEFYDDLPIARHALPFFHGLFLDSLQLFPESGKAAWVTYFPFHLVLYLAAAMTFGGEPAGLGKCSFLDRLGEALLTSFEAPNSQEMQRGLRTREHRFLTAFLCHFHPTPGVESIYRSFVQRERDRAGNVELGLFDLLYAPESDGPVAAFPDRPLFARDVGDVIATVRAQQHTLSVSLSGGPKAGRAASFQLMPQSREFAPSMGAFEVAVDGAPLLTNINISGYGLNSALTNTMCFEDGGGVTNGQYLNGAVPPEANAVVRRCLIGDRFLYAHILIAPSLDPKLKVRQADRIFVLDRRSGAIAIADSFAGDLPIRFATHLHCSGSVTDFGAGQYRLTGGQANLLAGMKGGSKGLDDSECGELFAIVLRKSAPSRVVMEEPMWIPGYIYGLNKTGREELRDGRFPRFQRWRLELEAPAKHASLLFALALDPGAVRVADEQILLPGGSLQLGPASMRSLGVECECECLLADQTTQRLTAMGLRLLRHGSRELTFAAPVDLTYSVQTGNGVIYADRFASLEVQSGFRVEALQPIGEEQWRTNNTLCAEFSFTEQRGKKEEKEA